MPAAEPISVETPSTSPTVTTPSSPTPTVTSPSDHNVSSPADNSENEKGRNDSPAVVEVRPDDVEAQREDQDQGHSLPAVDTSKDAWLFLAACFVMEAMVWGESKTRDTKANEYEMLTQWRVNRFSFRIRYLPRLLPHPRTLCRLIQDGHHRNLRHGRY